MKKLIILIAILLCASYAFTGEEWFNIKSHTMDDITDGSTYVKTTNDYTDAEQTKVGYITVTEAVDLDNIETTETVQPLGSISTDTAIDYSSGTVATLTIAANDVDITVTNWPTTGTKGKLTLWVTNVSYTGFTVCGKAITVTASATDKIIAETIDAGSTETATTVQIDIYN